MEIYIGNVQCVPINWAGIEKPSVSCMWQKLIKSNDEMQVVTFSITVIQILFL